MSIVPVGNDALSRFGAITRRTERSMNPFVGIVRSHQRRSRDNPRRYVDNEAYGKPFQYAQAQRSGPFPIDSPIVDRTGGASAGPTSVNASRVAASRVAGTSGVASIGRGPIVTPQTEAAGRAFIQQGNVGDDLVARFRNTRKPLNRLGRFVAKNPFKAFGLGLGAELLMSAVTPDAYVNRLIKDQIDFARGRSVSDQVQDALRQQTQERLMAAQMERAQQGIRSNIESLRQTAPELYQQLLVGRRLPNGAAVFGGGARPDFLEEVAFQMANNGYSMPENRQVQLSGTVAALQQQDASNIRFRLR